MKGCQLVVFFAIVAFTIVGCGDRVLFSEARTIDNAKWNSVDYAKFEFNVNDTVAPVDFYIMLSNEPDYKYSNLYMFLRTYHPNGGVSQDTIECVLADKRGQWLGKGLNSKDNKFLLMKQLRFPKNGKYIFELEQAMRVEPLEGISKVGIKVEKSK